MRICHSAGAHFVDALPPICWYHAMSPSGSYASQLVVRAPGFRMPKVCSTSSSFLSAFACDGLCLFKSSSYLFVRLFRIVIPQAPAVSGEMFVRWEEEVRSTVSFNGGRTAAAVSLCGVRSELGRIAQ